MQLQRWNGGPFYPSTCTLPFAHQPAHSLSRLATATVCASKAFSPYTGIRTLSSPCVRRPVTPVRRPLGTLRAAARSGRLWLSPTHVPYAQSRSCIGARSARAAICYGGTSQLLQPIAPLPPRGFREEEGFSSMNPRFPRVSASFSPWSPGSAAPKVSQHQPTSIGIAPGWVTFFYEDSLPRCSTPRGPFKPLVSLARSASHAITSLRTPVQLSRQYRPRGTRGRPSAPLSEAAKRFEQLSCATYRRLANRFGATANFLSERS
ncbi:hypothetical protein BPS26883_00556 [Burkholderia pseudomultivorans]|uniref:Uncharacterized protein n=1 Tax=Burkholderia pseudomultivorans TaxID=1207504 RepID=A0A6P2HFU9_9BURK|nr:hypothetical protein BPS26883_00556 [Burkholderia pseudomultivorans]